MAALLAGIASAFAPQVISAASHAFDEPTPPTSAERVKAFGNTHGGKVVAGVGGTALVAGGAVGVKNGYIQPARFAGLATPVCPSSQFDYAVPLSSVRVSGHIASTLPGWPAVVTCDGANEYSGPALTCAQIWISSFGFTSTRMQQYVFVESGKQGNPMAVSPGRLMCKGIQISSRLLESSKVLQKLTKGDEAPTITTVAVAGRPLAFVASHAGWLAGCAALSAVVLPMSFVARGRLAAARRRATRLDGEEEAESASRLLVSVGGEGEESEGAAEDGVQA